MDELPTNWNEMTDDQQNEWALARYLHEQFPNFTFKVTWNPFNIRINEDGANIEAIQSQAAEWFKLVWGPDAGILWGTPVHTEVQS